MADPRKADDRIPRDQFSISIKRTLHERLEKLAGVKRTTTSRLIENICEKEITTIPDATWDAIDKLAAQVGDDLSNGRRDRPPSRAKHTKV